MTTLRKPPTAATTATAASANTDHKEAKSLSRYTPNSYKALFARLYMASPINFSTLTGWRHPGVDIPTLPGDWFYGHVLHTSIKDGTGFSTLIDAAHDKAKTHPSGMSEFRLGPSYNYYLANHADLVAMRKQHGNKLVDHDASGIYLTLFGPSILTEPAHSELYRKQREAFHKRFIEEGAVVQFTDQLNSIIKRHFDAIKGNEIANLGDFTTELALDFMLETQLGFEDITTEDKAKLKQLMNDVLKHIANVGNVILFSLPEAARKAMLSNIAKMMLPQAANEMLAHYQEFQKIIANGKVLMASLIKKNLKYIQKNNSFIKSLAGEKEADWTSDRGIQVAAMILFAGSESTSRAIEAMLRLLSDPDPDNQAIAQSIANNIDNAVELDKLLKSLAQSVNYYYPSFPVLKEQVKTKFEHKGITFYPGDNLFYSALELHRTINGASASKFKLHASGLREVTPFLTNLTFGPNVPRTCPGRNLAQLEMRLVAQYFCSRFQGKLQNGLQHPYNTRAVYSLQFVDQATVKLQPRPALTAKAAADHKADTADKLKLRTM